MKILEEMKMLKDSYVQKMVTNLCKEIEKKHKVKILFAVENGSRAWNIESQDSDYDVRFVYVRPKEDYLKLSPERDVIEAAFDKDGKPFSQQGACFDMVGFDILKFSRLLLCSNPTVMEWLTTNIIYYGKRNPVFEKFARSEFDRRALYHHYKSMCEQNYLKYIKSGIRVTWKKYLYSYRGLVNALWVANNKTLPPNSFTETIEKMKWLLPSHSLDMLQKIIIVKTALRENATVTDPLNEGDFEKNLSVRLPSMNSHIESFIKDDSNKPEKRPQPSSKVLDKLAIETILKTRW